MTPTLTFTCSICGEQSTSICVYCTKDACPNQLCDRCRRCSDCCECDIKLEEHPEYDLPVDDAPPEPVEELAAEPEPTPEPTPVESAEAPTIAQPEIPVEPPHHE